MQKKLYFLNEEEKNRIINLHESITKKQYLLGEQEKSAFSSLNPASKIQSTFKDIEKQVEEAPKGVLTKTELDEFKKIKPQWDMARPVGRACKTLKNLELRIVDTPEQIGQIVAEIYNKFEDSGHSLYMNKSVSLSMGNSLSKFKSIPDLCYGIKVSSGIIPVETDIKQWIGTSVNDNFLKLFWDIYHSQSGVGFTSTDTGTAKKAIYDPLQKIIKASEVGQVKTKSPEEKTKEPSKTMVGWESFPCVTTKGSAIKFPSSPDEVWWKSPQTSGEVFYYRNDGLAYYKDKDGKVFPKGNDNYYKFVCDPKDNLPTMKIKEVVVDPLVSSVSVDSQTSGTPSYTPPSGVGVVTRNVQAEIPTVLQSAGIKGTEINQTTVDQLYNLLAKK